MWVRARKRRKNKEKCVSGATFLTVSLSFRYLCEESGKKKGKSVEGLKRLKKNCHDDSMLSLS
jgi:hypothetical protein